MIASQYSPTFKRFINADVVAGSITNAITLNRYAYANGNPVSNVDPFGLCSRESDDNWFNETVDSFCDQLNHTGNSVYNFGSWINQIGQWVDNNKLASKLKISGNGIYSTADWLNKLGLSIKDWGEKLNNKWYSWMGRHYNRNSNNMDFPDFYNPQDPFFKDWDSNVLASCHQSSSPDRSNIKLVSPDGKYEVIYDKYGNEVTDVRDVGTYNYVSPLDDGVGHFTQDVLPWLIWGNSANDSTTFKQRIKAFAIDGVSDAITNAIDDICSKINDWWDNL